LFGANQNEMVAAFDGNVYSNHWYWQDGRGNTSHITGDPGNLLERYTYDLNGLPRFYDEWGTERSASAYDTRFLFAGSQFLPDINLYDMRNRFYHITLNRFLQADPVGLQLAGAKPSAEALVFFALGRAPDKFASTELNLYRYCHNDPINNTDPMGLEVEIETRSLGLLGPYGFVVIGNHSWVKVVTEDQTKTTFSGTNKGTLGVEKNYKSDYNAIVSSRQVIPPPEGLTKKQWDQKVLREGEKQMEKNGKREYRPFGGDDGKTSGNCHTVTREIIEGAGGTIPKQYDPPGANPGLIKEKKKE